MKQIINFMSSITLLLIILRIVDFINWSWMWIFFPVLLGYLISLIMWLIKYSLRITIIMDNKDKDE